MTALYRILAERRLIIFAGIAILSVIFFHRQIGQFAEIDLPALVYSTNLSVGTLFIIIALSTLVSEDLTCLTAGALVSQGSLSFPVAVAACGFGIFAGDIMLFWAGRIFGRKALEIKFFKGLFARNAVRRATVWLEKYGMTAVLLSRFTPGLRLPLYLMAGILHTEFLKFTLYFLFATLVWTPVIVGIPAFFGKEVLESSYFGGNFRYGIPLIVIGSYFLLRFGLRLAGWRGRRLLLGKIKRLYKWEFWPLQVFYFPVAVFIFRLMVKHRSPVVFTCANPSMPAGGFAGESKRKILEGLASAAAGPFLPAFTAIDGKLDADDKFLQAVEFLSKNKLDYPVVLKPDVGERGSGVRIVRSAAELESLLAESDRSQILQQFAGGGEVSVFYFRYPAEATGKIFSITEKRFPAVTGDGVSTLEDLILKDSRAICLAKQYFSRNEERLFDVPAPGETVPLIDIGTHSLGAVFLDGGHLKTELLEAAIDRICHGYAGFYFGRFDIRIESAEDFRLGKNFKIIELNGVTSESTNIYDPRYSIFDAYRILFRQWRIAFEIGAQNRRNGFPPAPFREMVKIVFNHLTGR